MTRADRHRTPRRGPALALAFLMTLVAVSSAATAATWLSEPLAATANDAAPPSVPTVPTPSPTDGSNIWLTRAPTPKQIHSDSGPGGTEDLTFVCPSPPLGIPVGVSNDPTDTVVYGCPIRIHDGTYSLGNGAIALHHEDHNEVVFTSLHGGASDGRPHNHSRGQGQVHTTFTSGNHGITWADQPPSGQSEAGTRGSDNDVVLDSDGNIYVAYLYHDPGGPRATIGLFKADRPSVADMFGAYAHGEYMHTRDQYNRVDRAHLLHLPAHIPIRELAGEDNETAPSGDFGDVASEFDYANATEERVVAVWHETADDYAATVTGLSGYIDAAWTDTGPANDWRRLPLDELVGPCSAGSNAVQHHGKVYVACVVDKGYSDRSRARVGDIDMWEIDVFKGTSKLIGFTGMTTDGEVLLAQSFYEDNTYIGMLTSEKVMDEDGDLVRLRVRTGYAWIGTLLAPYGRMDQSPLDYGIQLRQWGQGTEDVPLNNAGVTAFMMTDDTYQSLLVYNEWHEDPQNLPEPDPNQDPLQPIRNRLTDYNKFFLLFNACDGAVAGYQAELGTGVDAYNAEQYTENPGVFSEPRDGLYKTRDPATQEEMVYFAMGDYGAMQYGAVLVNREATPCSPPPPPPFFPAALVPQALTTSSGVSATMAAAFGVPAAAMVGYLLTVKRRKPLYTTAEDN